MKEITTCVYDGLPSQMRCQQEEQCDDCFLVDHLKECAGCEHYDHPVSEKEEAINEAHHQTYRERV